MQRVGVVVLFLALVVSLVLLIEDRRDRRSICQVVYGNLDQRAKSLKVAIQSDKLFAHQDRSPKIRAFYVKELPTRRESYKQAILLRDSLGCSGGLG